MRRLWWKAALKLQPMPVRGTLVPGTASQEVCGGCVPGPLKAGPGANLGVSFSLKVYELSFPKGSRPEGFLKNLRRQTPWPEVCRRTVGAKPRAILAQTAPSARGSRAGFPSRRQSHARTTLLRVRFLSLCVKWGECPPR